MGKQSNLRFYDLLWGSRVSKYDDYLASPSWKERRKAYLALSPRCKGCGSRNQLQVHHNNYDHIGNELPEDVCSLCPYCHAIFEFMRGGNSDRLRHWLESNYALANAYSVSLDQVKEWMDSRISHVQDLLDEAKEQLDFLKAQKE